MTRWRSNSANGCVPAEPSRNPWAATAATACARSRRSSRPASRHVVADGRVKLDERLEQLRRDVRGELAARFGAKDASPRAGARSNVSASRSMYSSSMPTVNGAPAAEAMVADVRGGCELRHQIGSGSISIAPHGHSCTHSAAALAVVEVERVRVRAAGLELDDGVVGADAVAVVAREAAAARQAAAGLEQRGRRRRGRR